MTNTAETGTTTAMMHQHARAHTFIQSFEKPPLTWSLQMVHGLLTPSADCTLGWFR